MNLIHFHIGPRKYGLSIILFVLLIIAFLPILGRAEEVKGVVLVSEKGIYQTSVGKLKASFLLQNGNQVGVDSSGKKTIIFGLIHIGANEGAGLRDNVEIYPGRTNLTPDITFVQELESQNWVATKGTMCIDKGSIKLLDNSTIKIIGGKVKPVNIAGKKFSDTTVVVKDGKPFDQKARDNMGKNQLEYDQRIVDAGKNKAESLKLNPIPVFMNENGTVTVVKGTIITIKNNQWVLTDGDMLINAGDSPVKIEGLSISRGEYAIRKNGVTEKGSGHLISE